MVTIHPWSLTLLFVVQMRTCDSSPTVSRSNGRALSAEIKSSSCSQQLNKILSETRRHVSVLNAIADDSTISTWRNRKLLETALPREKSKPLPNTTTARIPAKTEEKEANSLGGYLSSLDHSGWVSKCLMGGSCGSTKPVEEPPVIPTSERSGSTGDTANASDSQGIGINRKISILVNETLPADVTPKKNGVVSDSVIKHSSADSNRVIDLLHSSYVPRDDSGSYVTNPVDDSYKNVQNHTSLSNQPVQYHSTEVMVNLNDEFGTPKNAVNNENANQAIEYAQDCATRTTKDGNTKSLAPELLPFASTSLDEASSDPPLNYFLVLEDGKPSQSNSLRYLPTTDSSGQLVHYSNHFLPLNIQFAPVNYYRRKARNDASVDKMTFRPNPEQAPRLRDSFMAEGKLQEVRSLDDLVADNGNDLFKRNSTGKREAITTNYPEAPGSPIDSTNGELYTRLAHAENGSDSNFYLFLGGSWMTNFKDSPRVFYIQPPFRQSIQPQPATETTANIGLTQTAHQPLPSSANLNCHSKWDVAPPSESPRLYPKPSYAVDEWNLEQSYGKNSGYGSRASNEKKVPSVVAARNGYSWYDYDSITNYVNSKPDNGPFNGGPVAFPTPGGFRSLPSRIENKNSVFRPKMDYLNYEDSLANFPPPKYEPPLVGSLDLTISKSEDFKAYDIDTADMVALGTQFLAMMPINSLEHRTEDSNDPSYGKLVADVSARSSPGIVNSLPNAVGTGFANAAFNMPELVNTRRMRPPNSPDLLQSPSEYFPPSLPNDFEFVSGQWIKRKPLTDTNARALINDQSGERPIRDIVMGWPVKSPSSGVQQPTSSFESKCSVKRQTFRTPIDPLQLQDNPLPQPLQTSYFENGA